jgi:hypothetical protein
MTSAPRVVLVHLGAPVDDMGDSAIALEDRVIALRRLAPALGLELLIVPAHEIVARTPAAIEGLRAARAVWWAGRMAFLPETTALWAALQEAVAGRQVALHDPPEIVDETFDLSRSYPALARAGVPQPATRFYPLDPTGLDDAALARAVARSLRWVLRVGRGRFVRTYYGTRKLFYGALNIARSKRELVEVATACVSSLRASQAIGGLAVRELLEIDSFQDSTGHFSVTREFRVFVLQGEPVLWMYHTSVADLRRRLSPEDQQRLGPLAGAQRDAVLAHARAAGRALRASLFAIDFAVVRGGGIVCLEVNPGHCSGWGTSAAFVRVHGELLRRLAGLPSLSREESLALARAQKVDLGGLGELFDFV